MLSKENDCSKHLHAISKNKSIFKLNSVQYLLSLL